MRDPKPDDTQYSSIVENYEFLLSDKLRSREKGAIPFKALTPRATQTRAPQASPLVVVDGSAENVSDTETKKPSPIATYVLNILSQPSVIPPGRTVPDIKADPVSPIIY